MAMTAIIISKLPSVITAAGSQRLPSRTRIAVDGLAHAQVILHLAHTRYLARDVFGLGLLRRRIDEPAQRHHALIRIDVHLEPADIWIREQRGLHSRCYRLVIQILARAPAMFTLR